MNRLLERSLITVTHDSAGSLARVDQARLRAIVAEHFEVLWRFLRRLGIPEHDVDDAVQEVILVLARKLEKIESGRERSFVLSTAFRVASGFRRSGRRRREVDDSPLAELEHPGASPESLLEQQRLRERLDVVLLDLPLELRAVFVLYELEELTMAEIAQSLGLRPGTAASRLRRARQVFEARVAAALTEGEAP